jgi:hypothetical protein
MNDILQLRLLATGGNQHVFVEQEQEDCEWVYKIPAAFGYILPWDYPRRLRRQEPRGRLKRLVYRTLFAPRAAAVAAANAVEPGRWAPGTPLEWAWAQYIRFNATRRFNRMLHLMELLSARGAGELLVPYRIERDRSAVLHVYGRAIPWKGTLLLQRKVRFRNMKEIIDHGRWEMLTEAQHRLWRQGIAVADVVRYTSWAVHDGRLCLADADSLTDSLRVARSHVSPPVMKRTHRSLKNALTEQTVEEFLNHMNEHINEPALRRLWGADVHGNRRVAAETAVASRP